MTKTLFESIQEEQTAWSVRNFGMQPAHRPALGTIEELCELYEAWDARDNSKIVDALGDVGIYLLDYCGKRGWSFQKLWEERRPPNMAGHGAWGIITLIRLLAHHQLKGEQGIRGGTEFHAACSQSAVSSTLWAMDRVCQTLQLSFEKILADVWAVVGQRDWVQNPNTAHEVAEAAVAAQTQEPG